jgi:midasin (ATPase involved in ribosome maturation)
MTHTLRPIGTVVPARFPGLCRNCRHAYDRGQLIRKVADKVWIHDACPNGEPPPATVAYTTPEATPSAIDVRAVVREELAGATLKVDEAEVRSLIDADVERIVGQTRDQMLAQGVVKQQLEVKLPNGDVRAVEGKAHTALPRCIRLAAARRNLLLVGPAGSGKMHLAAQVADALGLAFAHISCSADMSEGQLTGRLLPVGDGGRFEYVRSEFVRCYEDGGVFLFDEIDAAVRTVVQGKESYDFYEMHCQNPQCRARLAFGVHKGGRRFSRTGDWTRAAGRTGPPASTATIGDGPATRANPSEQSCLDDRWRTEPCSTR